MFEGSCLYKLLTPHIMMNCGYFQRMMIRVWLSLVLSILD